METFKAAATGSTEIPLNIAEFVEAEKIEICENDPLLLKYDYYRVSPVRKTDAGTENECMEVCETYEAELWGVYGYLNDHGGMWVADCKKELQAYQLACLITRYQNGILKEEVKALKDEGRF